MKKTRYRRSGYISEEQYEKIYKAAAISGVVTSIALTIFGCLISKSNAGVHLTNTVKDSVNVVNEAVTEKTGRIFDTTSFSIEDENMLSVYGNMNMGEKNIVYGRSDFEIDEAFVELVKEKVAKIQKIETNDKERILNSTSEGNVSIVSKNQYSGAITKQKRHDAAVLELFNLIAEAVKDGKYLGTTEFGGKNVVEGRVEDAFGLDSQLVRFSSVVADEDETKFWFDTVKKVDNKYVYERNIYRLEGLHSSEDLYASFIAGKDGQFEKLRDSDNDFYNFEQVVTYDKDSFEK